MSAASTSALPPSAQQILFARAVILTFQLWPSMRLAISEQWGGPDSSDKCDFLISHICDAYGGESGATSLGPFEPTAAFDEKATPSAPPTPEEDEIAETLEGYLADEFEARIEDQSCDYIAGRIVSLHQLIFARPASDDQATAEEVVRAGNLAVQQLTEAAQKLKGSGAPKVQRGAGNGDDDALSESGSSSEGSDDDMDVDEGQGSVREPTKKPEPIVDEDGFTTVVRGKKR